MRAIAIVAGTHDNFAVLLESMDRLRARMFRQRLNWKVTVTTGREGDSFDTCNPTDVVALSRLAHRPHITFRGPERRTIGSPDRPGQDRGPDPAEECVREQIQNRRKGTKLRFWTIYLSIRYPMPLTLEPCRAARASLDWTQNELAECAEVNRGTVRGLEHGRQALHRSTATAIHRAFEDVGIALLEPDDSGGIGVRRGLSVGGRVRGNA